MTSISVTSNSSLQKPLRFLFFEYKLLLDIFLQRPKQTRLEQHHSSAVPLGAESVLRSQGDLQKIARY